MNSFCLLFPFQVIMRADPHIGLLHRATEKLIEYKTYLQVCIELKLLNTELCIVRFNSVRQSIKAVDETLRMLFSCAMHILYTALYTFPKKNPLTPKTQL